MRSAIRVSAAWVGVGLVVFLLAGLVMAQRERFVYVNRTRLTEAQLTELERSYQTRVPDGSYWYDATSGLWGVEGEPAAGRIHPNLDLGGPLRADASGGGTDVFMNGREIHPLELVFLEDMFGVVLPGRYWLNDQGIGGFEGGPPRFDLAATADPDGGGGYTYRGPGGLMGGDGSCFYYNDPEAGSSYALPGC
jgi:hypothetical protein